MDDRTIMRPLPSTPSPASHYALPGSLHPVRPLVVGGLIGMLCCLAVWWAGVVSGTGSAWAGAWLLTMVSALVICLTVGLQHQVLIPALSTFVASFHAIWRVSWSWFEVVHMTAAADRADALYVHGPWQLIPPVLALLICPPAVGVAVSVGVLLGTGGLVLAVLNSNPSSLEMATHYGFRLLMSQTLLLAILGVVGWTQVRISQHKTHNETLGQAARIDELTSLANRRAFTEKLQFHVQTVRAGGTTPVALVLFDIDHFKAINDRHGHVVGDEVLRRFGQVLRDCCRADDTFGRWGGEEFGGLFVGMDSADAWNFTDRIRDSLSAVPWPGGIRMTVSAGVVMIDAGDTVGSVMQRVDQALYDAKSRGRDRVVQRERLGQQVVA